MYIIAYLHGLRTPNYRTDIDAAMNLLRDFLSHAVEVKSFYFIRVFY